MSIGPGAPIPEISWLSDVRNDPHGYRRRALDALAEHDDLNAIATLRSAVLHGIIANSALELTDVTEALSQSERAVTIELESRRGSDDRDIATRSALHCLRARALAHNGQITEARDCIATARDAFGPAHEWQFRIEEAAFSYKLGDLDDALTAVNAVLELVGDTNPAARARALNGRGVVNLYLGHDSSGLTDFIEAEQIYHHQRKALDAADVTYNKAMALGREGNLTGSLAAFDAARDVLESHDESIDQLMVARAHVMVNIGMAEEVAAELPPVIERLERNGMSLDAAEARLAHLSALLATGDPTAPEMAAVAANHLRSAGREGWAAIADDIRVHAIVELARIHETTVSEAVAAADALDRVGMRSFSTRSWLRVAVVADHYRRFGEARRALSIVSARRSTTRERIDAFLAAAWLLALDGQTDRAVVRAERGLRLIERQRSLLDATELQVHAAEWGRDLASLLVAVAWENSDVGGLWRAAERWRSAWLQRRDEPIAADDDELLHLGADYRRVVLAASVSQRAELPLLRDAGDDQPRDHERTVVAVERRLADALRRRPGGREASRPAPFDPDVFQRNLVDEAFVELVESRGRLRAVIATNSTLDLLELGPVSRSVAAVRALVQTLHRLAASPSARAASLFSTTTHSAARRVADQIVDPIAELLPDSALLVVSPSAGLGAVPWAALCGRPTCIVPSARWYAATARWRSDAAEPSTAPRTLLAIGPGLIGAAEEGARLQASCYPTAEIHSDGGWATSPANGTRQAPDLLHVAAHATFRSANPALSALHLGDGPLPAYQIERMPHPPSAAVLAACSSGTVRQYATGDGLGLTQAFLRAGSQAVVSVTAPIRDETSVDFFLRLHRLIADRRPIAAALATAVAATGLDSAAGQILAYGSVCSGRGDWRLPGAVNLRDETTG